MLGVVNTDLLKYFLEESYLIEKRTEYLTKIQSLNDDEVTEALIDDALDNMFRFRVKRDPGLCYHVISEAQKDELFLEKIRTIILQLYGKTVESDYTFESPDTHLFKEWDADKQKAFKTAYLRYKLEEANDKSDSIDRILAITTLLDEHESNKYDSYPLADNNSSEHILKNNLEKDVKCNEYIVQNVLYSKLGRSGNPDPINEFILIPHSFYSEICRNIFKIDPLPDYDTKPSKLSDAISLWKFLADLRIVICTEWFMSLDRTEKLECLNKTYPFEAEHVKSFLTEIKSWLIDPISISYLAEKMLNSGRYDLALECYSFLYENGENQSLPDKGKGFLAAKSFLAANVGRIYREISNYEKASEWYDKAKILAEEAGIPAYGIRVNISEIKYRLKYSLGDKNHSLNDYLKEIKVIHDKAIKDEVEFRLDALISITQSCRRVGRYDIEYKYLGELTVLLEKLKNKCVRHKCVSELNGDDIIEISFTNEGIQFNDKYNLYSKYADDAKKRMKEFTAHSCRFEELIYLEFNLNFNKSYQFYIDELNCFQIERAINNAEIGYKFSHNLQCWANYVTLSYHIRKNPEDKKKFCNDYLRLTRTKNEKILLHVFLSTSITECEGKITDEVKSELKYLVDCLTHNVKNCNNNLMEFLKTTLPVIALWKNDELKKSYLTEIANSCHNADVSKFIGMPVESLIGKKATDEELFSISEYFYRQSLLDPQYNHESPYCNLISLNGVLNKSSIAKKFGEEALSKYPNSFFIRINMAEYSLYETEYADAQKYILEAEELMKSTDETQWAEITKLSRETKETVEKLVESIKQKIDSFKGEYISFKKIRSPVAYRMMQTGDYMYFKAFKKQSGDDELDYSQIISQYGKAVEKLLDDAVTKHLRECLDEDDDKNMKKGEKLKEPLQWYLGDQKKSLSLGDSGWHGFYNKLSHIKNHDYLKEKLVGKYESLLTKDDIDLLEEYCGRLAVLRNGAAHMAFSSKEDVYDQRKKVVDLINSIIDITAKIRTV